MPVDDEEFNLKFASDRTIVENYFGRATSLWAILTVKYRWKECIYDTWFVNLWPYLISTFQLIRYVHRMGISVVF